MRLVPRTRSRGIRTGVLGPAVACLLGLGSAAQGQENPVFVDDSTLAADVLAGLPALSASGNEGEAVRLLQRLLEEEGDRLVVSPDDPALFESVRSRVHDVLLADQALLRRYREVESGVAETMLRSGDVHGVERTRLLTWSGYEAALRVAGEHLGAGRFESAGLALRQLERHPDRDDPGLAAGTAAAWSRVAAYLDRPGPRDAAALWAQRAGAGAAPQIEPIEWPPALRQHSHSPEVAGGALVSDDLVGTPLRSVDLQPSAAIEASPEEAEVESRRSRTLVEYPYVFPLVVDDTIYTSDGLWISAWDRFTLTSRWQTKPRGADNEREMLEEQYAARAYRKRQSRDVEEATTVSVHGRLLVAATGLVADGGRTGDPRLHAIDRATGRVLWSTYIDELDPQLQDASTRGPAVFEGDLAVVAVRKIPIAKRFASAYLVGIDLADGSAKWIRLAGSAGWLAYGGRGQWTDWPTLHEGVVYRVDELGVISAIEAGTGRFRWVRRLPGVESRMPSPRVPWAASRPVIDGDSMVALSPDRSVLLRLDLATGAVTGRRDARLFGGPSYIFREGERLVAVSTSRVAVTPIASFETGRVDISPLVPDPGIIGRVTVAGDALLLPVPGGLGVVTLSDLREGRGIELDASGNVVPLDNQLLTVDNGQLHSYLVWAKAAEILRARLDADPMDVSTAVTFAELAYRAGHPEEVLGPTDRALAAMGADPLGDDAARAQRRLFALMLEMLHEAERPASEAPVRLPGGLAGDIADRLGRVAFPADERATHLLMVSRVREAGGDVFAAMEACQGVIADPLLAAATWQRESSTVRAEIEALARLDDLLRVHGAAAYAPFHEEAVSRLAALRARGGTADEFESLARAFPRASSSPEAWLAAAERREDAGLTLGADQSLARAVEGLRAMRRAGLEIDAGVAGEVVGRRISSLIAHGRLDSAASELRRSDEQWPALELTAAGRALDRGELSALLVSRIEAREARPRIMAPLSGEAFAIEGWALMRALDRRDAFARRPGALMLSETHVGLWSFGGREGASSPVWTVPYESKPALVRFEPDRVLLYEPSDRGGSLLALDAADGAELWRTGPIGDALSAAEGAGPASGPERFPSPLDGPVNARDMVLALDETVIAAVSRSGRVVGFDAATGRALWTTRSACQAVHDAAAGDGVLVLGGLAKPGSSDVAGEPIVLMLDLASGEEVSRFTGAVGQVRWVRLVPGADRAVIGLSQGLVGLSIPEARADWLLTDRGIEDTSAAWVAGEHLIVQTPMLELAQIDPRTGELVSGSLDVQGRLDLGGPVDIVEADDRLVILSPAGCVVLEASGGRLIGADAMEQGGGGLVQPALAERTIVVFEREALPSAAGVYRLHVLDLPSGRAVQTETVLLQAPPRRIVLLDDVIFVTAGDTTIALPTATNEPQ